MKNILFLESVAGIAGDMFGTIGGDNRNAEMIGRYLGEFGDVIGDPTALGGALHLRCDVGNQPCQIGHHTSPARAISYRVMTITNIGRECQSCAKYEWHLNYA